MYEVTIDNFSGPLDLLLYLIKKDKMDILNIKLEVIINEYLDYIHEMERLNLDILSSYLVMSSELLEIKSRMLLPNEKKEVLEDDPKENLINRLIEYEKYKEKVEVFKELESIRSTYYTKIPSSLDEYKKEDKVVLNNVSLEDLEKAFKKVLERHSLDKPLNTTVTKKELSVEDMMKKIINKFEEEKEILFMDLFDRKTKEYLIVTFLAILELASNGRIKLKQECNFNDIICERVYGTSE